MEGRLNQSALKYAINLSASRLNVASKVANDLYGLNYYWKIREIAKDLDNQVPLLVDKLQQLQQQLAGLDHPHLVLSCEEKTYQELKKESFYGLEQLPTKPFIPWRGRYLLEDVAPQGRVIASPVAFIGKVFPTVSYTHPAAPALNIAAFLFDNLILHTRIREQGGAYGGGAVNNPMSGNFYFYSYRDPNISETMKAFEEAVQTVLKGKFDESDLEEAKLEMIQGLDAPISPGSRADLAYGWWRENRTFEMRQTFRHKLLALTKQNVIQAVEKELMPRLKQGTPVVFASKELLEKENQALQAKGLPPLAIESI
jgi:presequence protease